MRETRIGVSPILSFLFVLACVLLAPQKANAALTDGLVGHWTFDGKDLTPNVRDVSSNGVNGYLTNFTSTTTNIGKLGQALNFDGINDAVNLGNGVLEVLGDKLTLSAWVNANYVDGTDERAIIRKETNKWNLILDNTNVFRFEINTGSCCQVLLGTTVPKPNTWYHVVGVYDGAKMNLYVNGVVDNSIDYAGGNLTGDASNPTIIGASYSGSYFNNWNGEIDDVRVYNRALSANEVQQLYNLGKALTKPPNNLGLVGYWPFNEGSGTVAGDFSGNRNVGTLTNVGGGLPVWGSGKLGRALRFPSQSSVNAGDINSIDGLSATSFSVWVKSSAAGANSTGEHHIIGKEDCTGSASDGPFGLLVQEGTTPIDGAPWIAMYDSVGNFYNTSDADTPSIDDGAWHFLTGIYNGSHVYLYVDGVQYVDYTNLTDALANTSNIFSVGGYCAGSGITWVGSIDEVRIYNRVLSASEVAKLYQSGAVKINTSSVELDDGSSIERGLVGHWTFDGKYMTSNAQDASSNGNHGFLSGFTSTTTVIGKLGQALNFNGTDQQVTVPYSGSLAPTTGISIGAWVKLVNVNQAEQRIVSKTASGGYLLGLNVNGVNCSAALDLLVSVVRVGGGGGTYFCAEYATSNLQNNTWYFVSTTYDNSVLRLYVNGVEVANAATGGGDIVYANSNKFCIGGEAGVAECDEANYFNGAMDDVRMYNRALSASEVNELYRLGQVTTKQ